MPPFPRDLQERVVAPQHRPILQVEDHEGQGHAEDRIGAAVLLLADGLPQVFQDLVLLTAVHEAGIEQQQRRDQQFRASQLPMLKAHGHDGKDDQKGKIQTHGRPEESKKGRIAPGLGVRFLFHDITSQICLFYQIMQAFTIDR